MTPEFFRFPHIQHIAWLGAGAPRDDKVLAPDELHALLDGPVVVEEKLDGANLGFSLAPNGTLRAQNRGQYLTQPYAGQFQRLPEWMAMHGEGLATTLGKDHIAFGEWCAARHSLDYQALPDWWLLFDVYDRRNQRFWSTRRRDAFARAVGVFVVPRIAEGKQTLASLKKLVAQGRSRYRTGEPEGIVVRREDDDWLVARSKLVRANFTQAIDGHWRGRKLEWNQLDTMTPPCTSTPMPG
jgi:ATP-dependent RNA circularization protein (DNA/RNA ligase family)